MATSDGRHNFVVLSEKWVAEQKEGGLRDVLSPSDSLESFVHFCVWMTLATGRARSFETVMRAAAGFLAKKGKEGYVKDRRVKAVIAELLDIQGSTKQPMTHGTRRMLVAAFFDVIPRLFRNTPLIVARELLILVLEAIGALRVGEACDAVTKHGLLANNTFVLRNVATRERSAEVHLDDGKTGFARDINMVDVTDVSRIPVVDALEGVWTAHRLSVASYTRNGFEVLQPDSWSVKLSLLGVEADYKERLLGALELSARYDDVNGGKIINRLVKYAVDRHEAQHGGAEHKFVLLNEGPHAHPKHERLMARLVAAGLGSVGEEGNRSLVPAPLLRSTATFGKVLTPMPFQADSTYGTNKKIFDEAFRMANPPGDPDPEFDLQGHSVPRWNNHSWRRFADMVARDSAEFHGRKEYEVDLYAGWNLKKHAEDMQIHYAGMQRAHREIRKRITQKA